MNPTSRTLTFAAVAGVSALAATAAWYASKPSSVAGFGDVGQEFFAEFVDPTKATSLTVVDYDGDEEAAQTFSVKQNDDGLWVIPSHHNYPAEAEDRLASTATSLLGLKKTAVQSRNKDDWDLYGVVEPSENGAATSDERGTRLTLSDGSGNALVDLIMGKQVEGRDSSYYVREPEKDTTYVAQLDVDLSAKFSDWIEPDLLKINQSDIVRVVVDNYSIDEQRGTIDKKELLQFTKKDLETSGDWQLEGLDEEAEELDKSPISTIATNLDQLEIVGVRPKPEGLDDNMRVNPAVKQILQMQMQAQGYFIGGDKDGNERLYSNEGELVAGINNGVQYTLFFGEIARGTGKEIEVGLGDEAKADASKDDKEEGSEDKEDDGANEDDTSEDGPRRYLLVKADFNESLLGEKPVAPVEPAKPAILNEAAKEDAKEKSDDAAPAKEPESDDDEEDPAEPDACGADEEDADAEDEDEAKTEAEPPADEKPATEEPEADTAPQEKTDAKKPAAGEPADEKPVADAPAKDAPAADAETKPAPAAADEAATDDKPAADAKEDEKPKEPEADPKQVAQEAYDAAMGEYEAQKTAYESDLKTYEDKVKTGKEKADELSTRFAGWYYVISSDSFEKFRIERKDVVSKKETEEEKADDDAEAKDEK
ncbi:MAG: DUF4340 domain-containing protein [Fuerstiella sp.]|nr:DUF4340 domain-containing protein [Fuerstiella sp.]MCP4855951.1 DUF4340 domain-containing protein [Fuerstiella sp.]